MRIDSQTGFVKWTKLFYVKTSTSGQNFTSFEISQDQTAWIMHFSLGTPYIYRISANGTIVQVIIFGAINLSFSPTLSYISVISENEFMIAQDVSLFNGNISVGQTTGTDFSIARVSTDLSFSYNLMIDYGNGVEMPISVPIIYRENCFILSFTTYQGYLFTYFPINKSQIDIQKIKEHSYLLRRSQISKMSVQIYCTTPYVSNNLDEIFKNFICILCRVNDKQTAVMHFNITKSSFELTSKFDTNSSFSITDFIFYNSTLVYLWVKEQQIDLFGYILIFDTLNQSVKQIYINYGSLAWLSFFNGNIISEVIDLASGGYSIQKTNLDFESTSGCNLFQKVTLYNINVSTENPQLEFFDINLMKIILSDKYLPVYNISQTPYPLHDEDITDQFWPQSLVFGDGSVCQPSGLVLLNQTLVWNLTEKNLSFVFTPFANCQGIPIKLTNVTSSNIDASVIIINNDKVTIDLKSSINFDSGSLKIMDAFSGTQNGTIEINIIAETDTFIPITDQGSYAIKTNNNCPEFDSYPSNLQVRISDGLNLSLMYSNYCTTNFTSIVVSDLEDDSVYLHVSLNSSDFSNYFVHLDSNNCIFNLFMNTSNFNPGNYSMTFSLWDIFHEQVPVKVLITLEFYFYFLPEFASELPSSLNVQTCTESSFSLPSITDIDEDFSHIELISKQVFVKIQNATLLFNPTSYNKGQNTLMLELVDSQGLTNSYAFNVNVVDQFEYNPAEIDLIQAKYSKSTEASISTLLNQFANHSFSVSLKENNQDVKWIKYISDRQSILISNLTFKDIGVHNLSVSIFDGCYLKTFTTFVIVQVVAQHPPTAVGTISNVTAFQGQEQIELEIKEAVFYDKDNYYSIVLNCCQDVRINQEISFQGIKDFNPSSLAKLKFNKDYTGICESLMIAVDDILQTASIAFNIIVLKCPQTNCLYCNGPNSSDCTQCMSGYFIDVSTGKCVAENVYFDCWIIVAFTIIILIITVLTDSDVNASYVLLENITLYWILFSTFKSRVLLTTQYFIQLSVVYTQLGSLIFPYFDWAAQIDSNTGITNSFMINCITILMMICAFVLVLVFKHQKAITNKYILRIFREKALAKYMFWTSTYLIFCMLHEIINVNEFTNFSLLLLVIGLLLASVFSVLAYCLVIYSSQTCCICVRYPYLRALREHEFKLLDHLSPDDYSLIVRYNLARKLLLSLTILFELRFGLTVFLFTFLLISIQLFYVNLTIGCYQFDSAVTRSLVIFSEVVMSSVVLLSLVECLNQAFDKYSNLHNLDYLRLITVRINIMVVVFIQIVVFGLSLVSRVRSKKRN